MARGLANVVAPVGRLVLLPSAYPATESSRVTVAAVTQSLGVERSPMVMAGGASSLPAVVDSSSQGVLSSWEVSWWGVASSWGVVSSLWWSLVVAGLSWS